MSRLERIVAACGGILMDGGARALIPGPNHSHKDRSVSLAETEEGRILIHCFSPQDDWRDVRRALADLGLLDDEPSMNERSARWSAPKIATQPANEEKRARALRIWNESRPIEHTVAAKYLRQRAIPDQLYATPALRFHPQMTSLDDRARRPALVAAITDSAGEVQGVQVTLLTSHGTAKAPVATPRRVIGKLMGGVVRLSEAGDQLAIGEGVETMLSATVALHAPSWAALTAGNLARFEPPPNLRRLIVAADNDEAGLVAAEELIRRVSAAMSVALAMPPASAKDWNE